MNYPDNDTMVKMVNEDLLQFFDDYNPSEYKSVEENQVSEIIGEDGKVFVFNRVKGGTLGVWKDYFLDPELWKQNRLKKMQGLKY